MSLIATRLAVKVAILERHAASIAQLQGYGDPRFRAALDSAAAMIARALQTLSTQFTALDEAQHEPSKAAVFARAMVAGRETALIETGALEMLIEQALDQAGDDHQRESCSLFVQACARTDLDSRTRT